MKVLTQEDADLVAGAFEAHISEIGASACRLVYHMTDTMMDEPPTSDAAFYMRIVKAAVHPRVSLDVSAAVALDVHNRVDSTAELDQIVHDRLRAVWDSQEKIVYTAGILFSPMTTPHTLDCVRACPCVTAESCASRMGDLGNDAIANLFPKKKQSSPSKRVAVWGGRPVHL